MKIMNWARLSMVGSKGWESDCKRGRQLAVAGPALVCVVGMVLMVGCSTPLPRNWDPAVHSVSRQTQELSPGDQVSIQFFGAPELNSAQVVRRDGMISLQLIGDVSVKGLSPEQVEELLVEKYVGQLQIQEISVVVTSLAPVYVSGAVLKPGPVTSARSLSALEAIMEAGGFAPVANKRRVMVIRFEDGQSRSYNLDFKDAMEGRRSVPFYLEPGDIVNVPESPF